MYSTSATYIALGTQTDFEEPAKYCDTGVQCDIGHSFQRSSTPDVEPIHQYMSTTEESIDYSQEVSESMYEEPKPKPVITK